MLAGFPDGRANEGPSAGEPSLLGLRIAHEKGWTDGTTAAEPTKRPRAKKPAGEETSK